MSSTPRRCLVAVGLFGGFTHAHLRVLAMCSFPACGLARWGRASFTSSSRRPSMPRVHAARLRRCEPRRRPYLLPRPLCCRRRLQLFWQQPSTQQLALPFTQLCWRAPGRPVSSMKLVLSVGDGARSFNVESPGPAPRCLGACRAERCSRSLLRGDGGGVRTRLPCPVACKRSPMGVLTGSSVTPTRSRPLIDDRCWTQRRPPAGSSR